MKTEIRYLDPFEVDQAYKIAKDAYPTGEAPSRANLANLHKVAFDLFHGFFEDGKLVAFVCASRYYGSHVTNESFETHLPNGESAIIHCLCTHHSRRRRGIALSLLRTFVKHVEEYIPSIRRILLLCHAYHIPVFTRAGFVFLDQVELCLGPRKWYELEYIFFNDNNDTMTLYTENDDVLSDTIYPSELSTWTSSISRSSISSELTCERDRSSSIVNVPGRDRSSSIVSVPGRDRSSSIVSVPGRGIHTGSTYRRTEMSSN